MLCLISQTTTPYSCVEASYLVRYEYPTAKNTGRWISGTSSGKDAKYESEKVSKERGDSMAP
jgi:hypothetical protein